MTELQAIIVFQGRHFVHHLGICNPSCFKLLQIMSGVIPRKFKKNDVSISNRFPGIHKRGIHTDTHTDRHTYTHDDSIRRNAMHCISPKNNKTLGYGLHKYLLQKKDMANICKFIPTEPTLKNLTFIHSTTY